MSDFTSLYRPKKFSDVVGHEDIKKVLKSNRNLQVLLFHGPSGTGKTTLARIYAMHSCCENEDVDKCNGTCKSCKAIAEGQIGDLIEENVGDSRGIDDVRRLVDWLQYRPLSLKKRILILDEVHALTKPAQNMLLKVLEEPPKHSLIILCTTDPFKLIEPLRQRCFQFELRKINQNDLLPFAIKIVSTEIEKRGLAIEPDRMAQVLEKVIEACDGRPRKVARYLQEWFDGGLQEWSDTVEEEVRFFDLFDKLTVNLVGSIPTIYKICETEDKDKLTNFFEGWLRGKVLRSKSLVEVAIWSEMIKEFTSFYLPNVSDKALMFWKFLISGIKCRELTVRYSGQK